MSIKIPADDIAKAYRDWVIGSIVNSDKDKSDTGKFLLGVSSGSIGSFVAISTALGNKFGSPEWIALAAFVFSAVSAILMTVPKLEYLGKTQDIQSMHEASVRQAWTLTIVWMFVWIIGILVGAIGLNDAL